MFAVIVTVAEIDWGTAGVETPFEDKDGRSFLPASMAARVVRWVRPKDLLTKNKGDAALSYKSIDRGKSSAVGFEVGGAGRWNESEHASFC